ncbi:MAG: hypothetical protein PUA81_08975 [Oscillospiraceae bacterium]|nr:hypothetical protein [Oscillospiraceae bacterium]
MLRVIKHKPTGMYFASTDVLVRQSDFAKKFRSLKTAREYTYRNDVNFPRKDCKIVMYYREKSCYHDSISELNVSRRLFNANNPAVKAKPHN